MLTEEQKIVKKILLMPIECTSQETPAVFLHNGRIYSSQKYPGFDPDMSDLAVKFYQIIYRERLENLHYEILDENGNLKVLSEYKEFCGDTMNSYRTIEKKLCNDKKKEELKDKYHSLANFWLLPMDVGHSSSHTTKRGLADCSKSKNGLADYMDRFLEYFFNNHEKYEKNYPEYTESFRLEKFNVDHFLEGIYLENNKVTEEMKFSNKDSDEIAVEMCKRIEKRAELIAHKKGAELYKFFSKLRIMEFV